MKKPDSLILSKRAVHCENPERSTMPENDEALQDVAKAGEELSCRTRLMGPLLLLGALVALAQAKPAVAKRDNYIYDPRNKPMPPPCNHGAHGLILPPYSSRCPRPITPRPTNR
jgi:hypothetical protein